MRFTSSSSIRNFHCRPLGDTIFSREGILSAEIAFLASPTAKKHAARDTRGEQSVFLSIIQPKRGQELA
jgi:hypothetical protein